MKYFYYFGEDKDGDLVITITYEINGGGSLTGPFDTKLEMYQHALQISKKRYHQYHKSINQVEHEIKCHIADLKAETRVIMAEDVVKAFRKHQHNLLAVESGECCGSLVRAFDGVPPQRDRKLIVMNDGVLMRQMMLELGFSDKEIEEASRKV